MTRDCQPRGGVSACSEMKSAGTLNVSKKISETLQGMGPVPEQMWAGRARVPEQLWAGRAHVALQLVALQLVARVPRGVYCVLSRLLHECRAFSLPVPPRRLSCPRAAACRGVQHLHGACCTAHRVSLLGRIAVVVDACRFVAAAACCTIVCCAPHCSS